MNIYTEERSYWMGSDVAKYRRKRAVKLDWPGGPRGICHPALCLRNEPERLLMFHVRESDVQAPPRPVRARVVLSARRAAAVPGAAAHAGTKVAGQGEAADKRGVQAGRR